MKNQPNVIFVLTDDQGYPAMGCHGHPFIQTPHLDAFHNESARLDQFHVGPTCAPTRAGLLTGHYANSTGVWHTIGGRSLLRKDEWTLADALKGAGYQTALFGKWHLGDSTPYLPHERGFDTAVYHGGGGISQTPDYWGNDYFDDTYHVNGEPRKFEGYCTDVFFDEAIKYIKSHKDAPFFCYISTNAPHGPYNVEKKYSDLYKDKCKSEDYARFLGMITNIDENFGKLRDALQELNIEDDTILIFMSDNGQCGGAASGEINAFNAGMRGFKGSEYDGGHRAPFFIRYPNGDLKVGEDIRELSAFVDFMPTLLDLCGVDVPEGRGFHGESLLPLLKRNGGNEDSEAIWKTRCVVTDSQRLAYPIKWKQSCVMKDTLRLVNRDELYDLSNDPAQERDIAREHPRLVEEMREAYENWWRLVSVQFDDDVPQSIGHPDQTECALNCHDIRIEDSTTAWNQKMIREGTVCNGHWEILVERDGLYEFELRRWPKEAGHNVRSGIEGDDVVFNREGISEDCHGWYTGGKALDIRTACLKITGLPMLSKPINDDQAGVCFRVELKKGPTHIQTWFTNNHHLHLTAYYVYVKKVG